MPYNIKNNRGTIADPMSFRDSTNVEANSIATLMTQKAEELGVPVNISVDTVKEGGLFGSSYPCVVINHPNPPQEFFTDVYIINGNTVNFYFFGNSKANYVTNRAESRKGTLSGAFMNLFSGADEMGLQQEMLWHNQVYNVFESLVTD